MPSAPPYDRAVALPCRMSIFRDRWLYVRCACGIGSNTPIKLMLQEDSGTGARTLAETVVRTRCHQCGARPARIMLAEDGRSPSDRPDGGWAILLHEA